ncbi:extracellular calcium-sensing receptor-like [Ambystoma mexicanum]|uniref:extracellular calcium-sensing receptor-like n=1 Tax=Ambystoma mexicanum TaxID=8296 RepID=UPI0037E746ED
MVFAIEEINRSPNLLPNTTLGFWILDTCMSQRRTLRGILELLSGNRGPVPGYKCDTGSMAAGVIGELMSSISVPMARILGLYRFPQISYGSTLSTLSDKLQFPSFLRTVPGNTFQNIALTRLIAHFGWTWMGMVISDDDVGVQGAQDLKRGIEQHGGCVAFIEKIHLSYPAEKILRVVEMIRVYPVKVVLIHSPEAHTKAFMETLSARNVTDKVWIFSASFTMTPGLFTRQTWKLFNGTIGLSPHAAAMAEFENSLSQLNPSKTPNDILLKVFWEKVFNCKIPDHNSTEIADTESKQSGVVFCSDNLSLDSIDTSFFELYDLSYTYHTYLAVYAFAHALHALAACKPGHGPFVNGMCADINDIKPWQVLHYVKENSFQDHNGEIIFFDKNGDAPGAYDILNAQIYNAGDIRLVKVGQFDPRAPQGNDVIINMSAILWGANNMEVPQSVCSDSCPPGNRKAAREGAPVCCFDCVPCSQGEISNATDATDCKACPDDEWSNERRDQCIPKVIEFLSYEEPLGLTLSTSATLCSLLAVSVLCVFIKYRDTPIVKANNRGLSYLLLLALMFCFLCSFIFIGRPRNMACMLRQIVFGLVFSISVSSVLAKTIIVVIAFKATNPNSPARKWLGSKTPNCIVFSCSLVQVLICVVWLVRASPYAEQNLRAYNEKIIFQCNEGENIFFYCMLGYMGLLATVSFIVAFLSRNLPGSFNEAKLITFSMLVFVSVWISFIPAYLSTRGKYMVAVEVFAILCSSAGLLCCIFLPKCYIILVRPERNTKDFLVGKTKTGGKK